ncbi:hypothetical protein GGR04_004536 [Aureimonas pseudogalii]|uniref:Uncharacterized protein n=1 Tax=Aureimonas pseudogalii TaxID=1744844 RepID=A0A7W6H8Q5_9HYPH|nr:hypothetical protein [Aureimonas pseudogalii]
MERWFEDREALSTSRALHERTARRDGRVAAVAALSSKPGAPFFSADDEAGAIVALQARIEAAAPVGAMRIDAVQPLSRASSPSAPIAISFGFTATDGALHAFLSDIETRAPFLDVDELAVRSAPDDDGRILLSGTATLSAVPLIRKGP